MMCARCKTGKNEERLFHLDAVVQIHAQPLQKRRHSSSTFHFPMHIFLLLANIYDVTRQLLEEDYIALLIFAYRK